MLKKYKIVLALALCTPSVVIYGIRTPTSWHQIITLKLQRLFYQLKQVAEMQSVPINKYTAEVKYYSNSTRIDIDLKSGEQYVIDDYSKKYMISVIKGAPNNFYEIVQWDDRENHPLYPFLRDNGILDSKNAPDSLPKTIM